MAKRVTSGVGHFDIAGPDAELLGRFYHGVFNWRIDVRGPGYALVETPRGSPGGAIVEAENSALTIGVVVSDVDAALVSAVANGGSVAMPASDNGWVRKGVVIDPAGNRVTVIEA